MKKLLLSASLLGSLAIIAPAAAEAKTTSNAVEAPQIRVQIGNRGRRYRSVRTVTTTRIVGFGRNRYRETVRVTYLPNGRTITRVIARQRLGWGNNNWRYRRG